MDKIYRSPFADDIMDFFSLRKSIGFSLYVFRSYLRMFDEYCYANFPNAEMLSQDLVLGWINDSVAKGNAGMEGRGSAIRAFGRYLCSNGKDAYVLPPQYYSSKRTFTPYILSMSELASFFSATDRIAKWLNGDRFAPTVAPLMFRLMYTCGLRPTEVRELKNNDVNMKNVHVVCSRCDITGYQKYIV